MWFSREQFALAAEAKEWGLQPRFEPGDIVARGFADLGFEEFQVLPSNKLLSLTAGSITPISSERTQHFFWIPSIDEIGEILEKLGIKFIACKRVDQREWVVEVKSGEEFEMISNRSLHHAMLVALCAVLRNTFKAGVK